MILAQPPLDVGRNLTVTSKPVEILDKRETEVHGKKVKSVKICWERDGIREETWEPELEVLDNYPELFKDKSGLTGNGWNSGTNSSKAGENCHDRGPTKLGEAHEGPSVSSSPFHGEKCVKRREERVCREEEKGEEGREKAGVRENKGRRDRERERREEEESCVELEEGDRERERDVPEKPRNRRPPPRSATTAVDSIISAREAEPSRDCRRASPVRRSRREPVPSRRLLDSIATVRHRSASPSHRRHRSAAPSDHRRRSTAPSHLHH